MTHTLWFQQARHLLVIKELPTPYPHSRHTQKPKALITFKKKEERES